MCYVCVCNLKKRMHISTILQTHILTLILILNKFILYLQKITLKTQDYEQ